MPDTRAQGEVETVTDTGCTRCLISLPIVQQLGIGTKLLVHPICFEQINGMLIRGGAATLVMELVRVVMGRHCELIRFVITQKMTESIILGLVRLDKWGPTITWEDGY